MALPALGALLGVGGRVGAAAGGVGRAAGGTSGASRFFQRLSPNIQKTKQQIAGATAEQSKFNELLKNAESGSEGYNLLQTAVNGADAKVAKLNTTLEKQIGNLNKIVNGLGMAGKAIGIATGATLGFIGALSSMALKLGGNAEQLFRLAASSGYTVEGIQKLSDGFQQLGINITAADLAGFEAAQRRVNAQLRVSGDVNRDTIIAYSKLGRAIGDVGPITEAEFQRLRQMDLAMAEWTVAATGLPKGLVEALKDDTITSLSQVYSEGFAISPDTLAQNREAARDLRHIGSQFSVIGAELGAALLPIIQMVSSELAKFANKLTDWLPKIKSAISPVVSAIGTVGTVFKDVITFIKNNWSWLGAPFTAIYNVVKPLVTGIYEVVKFVVGKVIAAGKTIMSVVDFGLKALDKLGVIDYKPYESTLQDDKRKKEREAFREAVQYDMPPAVERGTRNAMGDTFKELADIDARLANKLEPIILPSGKPAAATNKYEEYRYTAGQPVMNAEELRAWEAKQQIPDYFGSLPPQAPAEFKTAESQFKFAPPPQVGIPTAPVRTIEAPEDAIKAAYPGQGTTIINNNYNYNTQQENSLNFNNDSSPADTAGEVITSLEQVADAQRSPL